MRFIPTSTGKLWAGCKDNVLSMCDRPPRAIFGLIWNLAKELDFLTQDEARYSDLVLHTPINDYDVPKPNPFGAALRRVLKALRQNQKVLIHCNGGHGRTGMAVAIVKRQLDGVSVQHSLHLARLYCQGPETKDQCEFVSQFDTTGY